MVLGFLRADFNAPQPLDVPPSNLTGYDDSNWKPMIRFQITAIHLPRKKHAFILIHRPFQWLARSVGTIRKIVIGPLENNMSHTGINIPLVVTNVAKENAIE
jgi:hypothetical protein